MCCGIMCTSHNLSCQTLRKTVTSGVSHSHLAINIEKYINAKEQLPKLKCFTMQKYNLQKGNQNPSRYYNSITNLKFQHNPKYHLSKIFILK
jgi:hypothetical protein